MSMIIFSPQLVSKKTIKKQILDNVSTILLNKDKIEVVVNTLPYHILVKQNQNNQDQYLNRGYVDILLNSYFQQKKDGMYYRRKIVRVWDVQKLYEYYKEGRFIGL